MSDEQLAQSTAAEGLQPFTGCNGLRKFRVCYYTRSDGRNEIEVEAESREEAIEIAQRRCEDFDQLISA